MNSYEKRLNKFLLKIAIQWINEKKEENQFFSFLHENRPIMPDYAKDDLLYIIIF